jgi:uncharacterized YigZ family protein
MEKDQYRTIKELSQGLYKEKGSKFIAIAVPVESADEVKLELELLRKKYHDARHHCYAYRLGEKPYEFRSNDDGEPSGTAGKPIFGQIQSFELTNILVVVIRYFGGVKLGTGGLIQAYRAAARDAIENGTILTRVWKTSMEIHFDYAQMNDVMRVIKDEGLRVIRQDSGEKCRILLEINKGIFEVSLNKLKTVEKLEWTVI